MASIFWFNVVICVFLLLLTILFSLLPLFMKSQSTNSFWHRVLQEKLPFLTAGVFLSTGMIHLLPDAVKLYDQYGKMMEYGDDTYPLIYLLACMGCFIVWAVDSLNFGDSGKIMAVAAAAQPNYETSICRIHVPPIASFGIQRRTRTLSADAIHSKHEEKEKLKSDTAFNSLHQGKIDYGTCSCDHTMLHETSMIKRTRESTEVDVMLAGNKCAVDVDQTDCCVSDPHVHAHVAGSVSEHIVFSGDSAILPYLLAALFSLHSLIAGFTLGMNSKLSSTAFATALAIVSHKFIEAMSVGANFAKARNSVNPQRSIAVLVTYSFMTPMGIIAGMLLTSTLQGPPAVLAQAVALGVGSGSFIYLAFHEVTDEDASQGASTPEKLVLFLTGVSIMAAIATVV